MRTNKGSSSVAKHPEPACCIIVAPEINLSPWSIRGREVLCRPENENALRGIS
jgi:hypothetical protein